MKKNLFLASILLFLFSCSAEKMNFSQLQDRNGLYYLVNENKPFTGEVNSYVNGKVEFEGEIENGLRTGIWTYYYPSGQKKMEGSFREGLMEGNWIFWKENGEQEKIEVYKFGKLLSNEGNTPEVEKDSLGQVKNKEAVTSETKSVSGEMKQTSEPEKKVKKESKPVVWESLSGGPVKYLNGIPYTGSVVKYFNNGNLELEGYFLAGKRSGKWTFYFPTGTVKNVRYY